MGSAHQLDTGADVQPQPNGGNTITVSAFGWVPPFAQGLARDLRVRWALEEAGMAYQVRLVGPEELASEDYRKQQPFGQVPVLEAYRLRCEARPAFQKAMGDHMAPFARNAPA